MPSTPEGWLTLLGSAAGFMVWMTAMWVRAGRILQRIDDVVADHATVKKEVAHHERRLNRLEVIFERKGHP